MHLFRNLGEFARWEPNYAISHPGIIPEALIECPATYCFGMARTLWRLDIQFNPKLKDVPNHWWKVSRSIKSEWYNESLIRKGEHFYFTFATRFHQHMHIFRWNCLLSSLSCQADCSLKYNRLCENCFFFYFVNIILFTHYYLHFHSTPKLHTEHCIIITQKHYTTLWKF